MNMNNRNFQLIIITIVFFIVVVGSGFLFYKYLTNTTDSLVNIESNLKTYQIELEKCRTMENDKTKNNCEKYISQIEKKLKEYEARLGGLQKSNLSSTVNFKAE